MTNCGDDSEGRQAWYYKAFKITQCAVSIIDVILDRLSASLCIQFIVPKHVIYNCDISLL